MPHWQSIVENHAGLVWQTIRRLLDHEADAADCFQDTFLAAFEASRVKPVTAWPAFLVKIATNRALDRLRRYDRERRRTGGDRDVIAAIAAQAMPHEQAEERELLGRLRQAVAGLPEDQAEVFWMAMFEPLSHADIAAALGITPNHVGVLLHRARKTVQSRLLSAVEAGNASPEPL